MEDPVAEIPHIISLLTQTPPSVQQRAIQTYFTPNASFTHPFCRTGSWANSRGAIESIYRWYKILSPRIELSVRSVAFDPHTLTLYVTLQQLFSIWFIPFHRAPVTLVTVLQLQHNASENKYYIHSQNDLYQVDEFVKFVTLPGGWVFVWVWQFVAMAFCVLGAVVGAPVSWAEERWGWGGQKEKERESVVDGIGGIGEDDGEEIEVRKVGDGRGINGVDSDAELSLLDMERKAMVNFKPR